MAVAVWALFVHVAKHTDRSYPWGLMRAVGGRSVWENNIRRPMEQVARDLTEVLGPNGRFILFADGAIFFYLSQERLAPATGAQTDRSGGVETVRLPGGFVSANNVRAALAFDNQMILGATIARVIDYENSNLKLVVFAP